MSFLVCKLSLFEIIQWGPSCECWR